VENLHVCAERVTHRAMYILHINRTPHLSDQTRPKKVACHVQPSASSPTGLSPSELWMTCRPGTAHTHTSPATLRDATAFSQTCLGWTLVRWGSGRGVADRLFKEVSRPDRSSDRSAHSFFHLVAQEISSNTGQDVGQEILYDLHQITWLIPSPQRTSSCTTPPILSNQLHSHYSNLASSSKRVNTYIPHIPHSRQTTPTQPPLTNTTTQLLH
jgi:hypothetical protein